MSDDQTTPDLQILITSGAEAPEKAVLGLAAALSAVHSGLTTQVVFAMRGALWCAELEGNSALVPGYPSVGELMASLIEDGGKVFGCSSCIDQYCPAPDDERGAKRLRPGVGRIGLTTITLQMADTRTVTF